LKIHFLLHVPFENPEYIEVWAKEKGHILTKTLLYEAVHFPEKDEFDWLIIMGGPMGANDEQIYPWLSQEKQFIKRAIDDKKIVLGICLGAQLITAVLGGRVYPHTQKEIGWFPVTLTEEASGLPLLAEVVPKEFMAFHWHGDTFDLADRCVRLASSVCCRNQAFLYQDHVVGLQFHLESSKESIQTFISHCGEELVDGEFIQPAEKILAQNRYELQTKEILFALLDQMEKMTYDKR
jgi:GMP synthase-like glutamine amidotransferase